MSLIPLMKTETSFTLFARLRYTQSPFAAACIFAVHILVPRRNLLRVTDIQKHRVFDRIGTPLRGKKK